MEKSKTIHIFDKNWNLRNLSLLFLLREMFKVAVYIMNTQN